MFDSCESSVGERIRYYRKRAQMTQKQLAESCGITEPAIRNYELGNRIPSYDTLDDIAAALQINYYTLADPNLSALAGVMHVFFRMEYAHGLKPVEIHGKAALIIDPAYYNGENTYLQQMLNAWLTARTKLDGGEWSAEQYENWETRYPFVAATMSKNAPKSSLSVIQKTEKPKRKRAKKKK